VLLSAVVALAISVPACVEAVPGAALGTARLSGALGLVVPMRDRRRASGGATLSLYKR
jgi:hypothetical protein